MINKELVQPLITTRGSLATLQRFTDLKQVCPWLRREVKDEELAVDGFEGLYGFFIATGRESLIATLCHTGIFDLVRRNQRE